MERSSSLPLCSCRSLLRRLSVQACSARPHGLAAGSKLPARKAVASYRTPNTVNLGRYPARALGFLRPNPTPVSQRKQDQDNCRAPESGARVRGQNHYSADQGGPNDNQQIDRVARIAEAPGAALASPEPDTRHLAPEIFS
jgi:hypothetical protein